MDGHAKMLLQFMDGADKRFLIPVYQRNYDWKIANCKQLYDDLIKVIKDNRKYHFFGSIVSVYDMDSDTSTHDYLIIDGQQRLTTISLLMLAMRNILEKGILVSENTRRAEKIYKAYLVDEYAEEETRIKLKPVKNDRNAFKKLFGDEEDYYKNSNLTINYEYFYNRIQKEEISIDDLFKAIQRLQIVSIELNNDDNPQLIFESLNSTGLDLTEGDKIRNFMLMGQGKDEQNTLYEKFWNPIELATKYDVSMFVRDYLSIKTQMTPSINNVYEVFKKYASENYMGEGGKLLAKELLEDLFLYAKYYEILLGAASSYDKIDSKLDDDARNSINRLNWLETTVTRPFLLEVLKIYYKDIISIKDLHDIFHTVENYLFRRNICDVATNALNKIFLNLNKEILRYDGTYDEYVEKMKYTLLSKKESGRFPDDVEFSTAFSEKNIYNMRGKYRTYILERIENFGTKETKDVYKHIENGTYTIEHIMPQHLTPIWMEELGEDYQSVHDKWLHRIANLTLTAYNSKYSNEPFEVKKTLVDSATGMGVGFKNSGLRMNQWIGDQEKWTEAELEERDYRMTELAKRLWLNAKTAFKPSEKPMDSVALSDDIDLTGRQISKFSYKGAEQPVNSWADAYQRIIKILHQEDESVLTSLAFSDDEGEDLAMHVITKTDSVSVNCAEIADGIYLVTGISTKYKMSNLQKFFKLYNADADDLLFYLKDENTESTNKSVVERHELRKRYWEFALPIIQEENKDRGCFGKDNPTIANWISGAFGIQGFSVNCVANYDGARVEIYFGKSNIEENKNAYDILYEHKDRIEESVGKSLNWERADESKYSKVSLSISDVGITNEADWKRMAKFHAEWSKKLLDAALPYLVGFSI